MRRTHRPHVALAATLGLILSGAAFAQAPAAPAAAAGEVRYTFSLAGKEAGFQTTRRRPDGSWEYQFELNDRGRGPKTTTVLTLGPGGVPARLAIDGNDYLKNPVAERFTLEGGRASWKNAGEQGESAVSAPAFYSPAEGPPEILAVLARALLAAPGGKLALLPAGEASISKVGTAALTLGDRRRTVVQYAVSGLGFTPIAVWLDEDGTFFAHYGGWPVTIRAGWEEALPQIVAEQDKAEKARAMDVALRLSRRPPAGVVVTNARLFDPETGKAQPGTTVVVSRNRIQAVGPDGQVAIPKSAEVIDARGKMLLPGLWDMHTHVSADDGLLHLAAGVTSVRDLANDIDQLMDLRQRWGTGRAIGPRIVAGGFLDGPGPYAGPTKVLVDDEAQVKAALDRYAELGYEQVKIYSSIRPELVPVIVAEAKKRFFRVSGHVPAFMTAQQAVEQGFDEIQHLNFLFLNFLFDKVQDTRTVDRVKVPAEQAALLDLKSEKVRAFIQLLADKKIEIDPTVNVFEELFTARPGQVSPVFAAVADRLPVQVRRGLYRGGLPVPEGMDARYRDSFRAFLRMIKQLYDAGVPLEAGTDALAGFALHRELELYVEAGIPAPEVLRIATLGAARILGKEAILGTVAPGKLADFILVDGDPTTRISDIRRVTLTVKDGAVHDPAALYRALGVRPAVE
jgi:imidazolonepropionase-like amidohydrolase